MAYTTIPSLSGQTSGAEAINASGVVVGYYRASNDTPVSHGFVYSKGRMAPFNAPGAYDTHPLDINDRGDIVGWTVTNAAGERGFLYEDGTFKTINPPGASSYSLVTAINNKTDVIGFYGDTIGTHGFLYQDGRYSVVNVPGAQTTEPWGINNKDTIVGEYYGDISKGIHGFIDNYGVFTTIDSPIAADETWTIPSAINSGGEVVGSYGGGINHGRGFTYKNGVFTTINFPGATETRITDVNDRGDLVGWYDNLDAVWHGFVDRGGVFTTVDPPGAKTSSTVHSINNSGQVAGAFGDANYVQHAFTASKLPLIG